jgi:hypothetical protein
MPDHDALYHRLFSHPGMVAQLLREFVAGPWLDELDLDAMERMNAKFHAETTERRDGVMIWRIPRRGGGDTYLVLLLEFQSTPDHWMALRALVYAGLLWQHLVKEQRLPADGRLPPVLPVVVYNGDRRWAAPVALHALIGLPEDSPLWRWQPDMRYHMIDEGAFGEADLERRDALPALLFRLESSPDPQQVVALADAVLAWFARYPGFAGLRSVFAELLGGMMGAARSAGSGAGGVVGGTEHACVARRELEAAVASRRPPGGSSGGPPERPSGGRSDLADALAGAPVRCASRLGQRAHCRGRLRRTGGMGLARP